MARRIIKPFTVEVRRDGHTIKPRVSGASGPASAFFRKVEEQSRITGWPGIDQEPAGSPQEAEPAPAAVIVPTGRILPVLNNPEPVSIPSTSSRRRRRAVPILTIDRDGLESGEVAEDVQPMSAADPEAEELKDDVEQPEDATPVDAPSRTVRSPLRQGRPHLSRDAFRREE